MGYSKSSRTTVAAASARHIRRERAAAQETSWLAGSHDEPPEVSTMKKHKKEDRSAAWTIVTNGGKSHISMWYCYPDIDPSVVLESWAKHMRSLGYRVPDDAQAVRYIENALDSYGVGRGG
jgi:hypothetical protein